MKKAKKLTKTNNYNGILYKQKNNMITIVGVNSSLKEIKIPDFIDNIIVNKICKNAFKNNKNLTKIILSNNIKKLGAYSFYNCTNLKEVYLSSDIEIIEKFSFYNCINLEKVYLPFDLKTIKKSAFKNCYNLTNLPHYLKTRNGKVKLLNKYQLESHLPIKVSSIESNAFENCKNLTKIYIPYLVETINKKTFKNCNHLKEVLLHNNIKRIESSSFIQCYNLKSIKLSNKIKHLSKKSFDKNTKIIYYNNTSEKVLKIIKKYTNYLINNNKINIESKMNPKNKETFYTNQKLQKAIEKYELRQTFKEVNTKNKEISISKKSRYTLKDNTYIYENKRKKDTATIIMTGDVMCRSYQVKTAFKNNEYNFDESFKDLKTILNKSDFAICNLETSISKSIPYCSEKSYVDDVIHMNAPSQFVTSIKKAGFDMIINANNHIYDTGTLGIFETLDAVNKNNLIHTGVFTSKKDKRYVNILINGINIGIISYCSPTSQLNKRANFSSYGLNTLFSDFSSDRIKEDIKNTKKDGAEFIIAYCHWGVEYTSKVYKKQKEFAQMLANSGADYLFGSHPHCLQHYETIITNDNRKVPCLYSAGNFISDMAVKLPETRDTLITELKLSRNEEGKVIIKENGYHPCLIIKDEKIRGGTKTTLLQELIDNNTTDKDKLYNDIIRIKKTIGNDKNFKMLVTDNIKNNIPDVVVKPSSDKKIIKKRKKLLKRIINKGKNFLKNKIYNRKKQLTLEKICKTCGIELPKEYKKYKRKKINNISLSTKTIKPNSILFTRFKNYNQEQLKLIRDNCTFVISTMPISGCKCIILNDPIKKAIKIFQYLKSLKNITTIAVTGSVGKTSTKEVIEKVLFEKYKSKLLASKGNSNVIFRIGENILKIKYNTKVYLQEVGIGKTRGNMDIMGKMLEPNITIYTNIKDSHIEGYGSRENIFKEKMDLSNNGPKNGLVLINYDDEILRNHNYPQTTLSYSLKNPKANYYAKDIKVFADKTFFKIVDNIENTTLPVEINALGEHNVLNSITAYAVGKYLKINDQKIVNGIKKYKTSKVRQNIMDCGKYKVIVDCYNSSYDGIKSILQVMKLIKTKNNGKKIAIIGDIFELGEHSKEIHKQVGKLLNNSWLNQVIFYGKEVKYSYEECKKYNNNVLYFETRKETIEKIKELLKQDDIILFKASHGMYYLDLIDTLFGTKIGEATSKYDKKYITQENNEYLFDVHTNNVTITKYLDAKEKIIIPNKLNNIPVEKLDASLFEENKVLKEIVLPEKLTRIGEKCFKNSSIEKIVFNKELKLIAKNAFSNCNNLKEIIFPEGLLIIEENVFKDNKNLKEVYIPDSTQMIEENAFSNTKNVTIKCNKNSYAEKYAKKNGLKYIHTL